MINDIAAGIKSHKDQGMIGTFILPKLIHVLRLHLSVLHSPGLQNGPTLSNIDWVVIMRKLYT